jgi:hypothetical protein
MPKCNLTKLLKDGFQVLSVSKKKLILGKGLLRLIYDPALDEVESTYILNK